MFYDGHRKTTVGAAVILNKLLNIVLLNSRISKQIKKRPAHNDHSSQEKRITCKA